MLNRRDPHSAALCVSECLWWVKAEALCTWSRVSVVNLRIQRMWQTFKSHDPLFHNHWLHNHWEKRRTDLGCGNRSLYAAQAQKAQTCRQRMVMHPRAVPLVGQARRDQALLVVLLEAQMLPQSKARWEARRAMVQHQAKHLLPQRRRAVRVKRNRLHQQRR